MLKILLLLALGCLALVIPFSTFAPIGSRAPAEHVQAVRSLAAAKGLSV